VVAPMTVDRGMDGSETNDIICCGRVEVRTRDGHGRSGRPRRGRKVVYNGLSCELYGKKRRRYIENIFLRMLVRHALPGVIRS
jgi:hypothetical protein